MSDTENKLEKHRLNSETDTFVDYEEAGGWRTYVSRMWYEEYRLRELRLENELTTKEFYFRLNFTKVRLELLLQIADLVKELPESGNKKFKDLMTEGNLTEGLGMLDYRLPEIFLDLFHTLEKTTQVFYATRFLEPIAYKHYADYLEGIEKLLSTPEVVYDDFELTRRNYDGVYFNDIPLKFGLKEYYEHYGYRIEDYRWGKGNDGPNLDFYIYSNETRY